MTSVWLDNLTAVTVTDCCSHENNSMPLIQTAATTDRKKEIEREKERETNRQTKPISLKHHVRHRTYLQRLFECREADCWLLSRGSPAETLAFPLSHNVPSHIWEGKTTVMKAG